MNAHSREIRYKRASLVAQLVKNRPAMQDTQVQSLGWEDPLEKGMATHSSILSWRIPWTEEPGRLQSFGSQRVGRDWDGKGADCGEPGAPAPLREQPWSSKILALPCCSGRNRMIIQAAVEVPVGGYVLCCA